MGHGGINAIGDIGSPPLTQAQIVAAFGFTPENTANKSNDTTLASNSATFYPTVHAVKAYVDSHVTGGVNPPADLDCSANPNYPAANAGDSYLVTVAGKVGGASGQPVDVGDLIVCKADNAGGTQASVGSSWYILEHNLAGVLLAANNLSDLTSYTAAQTNLHLVPGVDVQAYDATISALAALTITANSLTIGTGADAFSQTAFAANTFPARASTGNLVAKTITDFGLSLVDDADGTAARITIGVVIGTDVQAFNSNLTAWQAKTVPSGVVVGTTDAQTLTNKTLTAPAISSPTGIVKADVGLGNVDNTSDANKPVSTAQQTALDAKVAGPASATDNAIARFDLTTGKIIQNSAVTIADTTGAISGARSISLSGSSSGSITFAVPAAAGSNTVTFPAGTTDFSSTGGTGQFVKQSSAGAALTVATILAADIPSGIDAANIANGSVSNAEFQRLDGVTGAIQTQIDGKKTDSMSSGKLLGRGTASTGAIEEITLGVGLSFTGTTLNVSTGAGTGDVVGPASATDNAIARFDATTGKLIQNSAVTIADTTGVIAGTQGITISGSSSGTIAVITPASAGSNTITLPAATDTLVGLATTDTLQNKTLTAPKFASGGFIADANGGELFIFTTTASAVNEITFANAATGTNPKFTASGGDTDVGINFQVKGAGVYNFLSTANGPSEIRLFEDTDNGSNYVGIIATANMAGNRTWTIQDATDTFVGRATTDVLTNKDLTSGTNTFPTFNQNTTGSAAKLTTARTIGGVSFDGTANITVSTATGGFTVSGGDLAIGANNFTITGSIGATGSRVLKGWFTDLQVTNAIAGSITGNAATVTNATLTTALTVNTGTVTLTGNAANTSVLTIGAGSVSVSGTNTGDQTITLTGAVTGSGTGSFATTLATPGTLTVSSSNSNATNHTHAITSSSTPGAAASILATDSSGILGSTGSRIVKIWAVDLAVTNAIAGSITGSAPTLTTPRSIYGNNFDGSAALAQIIASTFGGTGNGFTKFSGPATTEKTKTLRDATDTILELGGSYTPTGNWTSLTLITPVLGTPASGTLTNCSGLPISGLVASTSTALGVGSIELGHATANTLTAASGVLSIEGVVIPTVSSTHTLTNKWIQPRTGTTTSSATPTINTDNVDYYELTAQAVDITSFTTNLTGTPVKGQKLWISIVGTAARAITWGAKFESSTATLPTTTVTTARLDVGFVWNDVSSKWRCVAFA